MNSVGNINFGMRLFKVKEKNIISESKIITISNLHLESCEYPDIKKVLKVSNYHAFCGFRDCKENVGPITQVWTAITTSDLQNEDQIWVDISAFTSDGSLKSKTIK